MTAVNITDDQIRELRADANSSGDDETRDYCDIALGRPKSFHLARGSARNPAANEIDRARARCAAIIIARARQKCPGRDHRNHVDDVCDGTCCTACGGPIDDREECRC